MVSGLSVALRRESRNRDARINYTGLINATCKRGASANGHVFTELEHKPDPRSARTAIDSPVSLPQLPLMRRDEQSRTEIAKIISGGWAIRGKIRDL